PGRTLAAYSRYVEEHRRPHRRVRVIGEPIWQGRTPAEEAEWTRYESVLNAAFARSPAWILCPYNARVLPDHIVSDARRTHPGLVTGPGEKASSTYTDPAAFLALEAAPLPPAPATVAMELRFDSDLGPMRDRIGLQATLFGLSPDRAGRLVLAVNEVASNAVIHGGGHGGIQMWTDQSMIICDVSGPGRMDAPFAGYLPPDPATPYGQGLWIVRQICDLVQIRATPSSTQVRLHFGYL
ncbi:MAG: sensor histidine kinase, partial [Streptosporangiaceae bacterium]